MYTVADLEEEDNFPGWAQGELCPQRPNATFDKLQNLKKSIDSLPAIQVRTAIRTDINCPVKRFVADISCITTSNASNKGIGCRATQPFYLRQREKFDASSKACTCRDIIHRQTVFTLTLYALNHICPQSVIWYDRHNFTLSLLVVAWQL